MGVRTIGRFTNTNTVTYTANADITFSDFTVSSTAIATDGNGGIILKQPGTYLVIGNFTAVATAINTTASVQMQENGTDAAGAVGSTFLDAVGDTGTISIVDLVTVKPQSKNTYATLTFSNVNATSFSNTNIIVLRVC